MLLKGKNVVVTGCLKGIGRATMELFARNGANIWACCQFQDTEFEESIDALQEQCGVWIVPVYFDLMEYDQVRASVKTILSAKQPVDVLVNIAGMTQDALFQMISMKQLEQIFQVNFFAQMLLTQYIVRAMLRRKAGSVINMSSISAIDGNPGQLSYSASKAALIGATKTLSAELAPSGIRVNAIAPGVIKTDMTKDLPDEKLDKLVDKSSLKRLGLAKEVANALLFLASDMSSYVTGQVLRVDGGIG